jgi:TRAP-type C4-dicarboxylate transport system permease small subunit
VKIVNSLSGVMLYAAIGVVGVLMLLTVSDVTGRYLFNHPIIGTTEITEYLMACLLLGMAPCALARRHIKIDIFFGRLRPRVQAILESIYYIFGLGAVAILTWTGFKQSLLVLSYGSMSSMLEIPDFPFITVLVVSYAILFLVMMALLIQKIGEVAK